SRYSIVGCWGSGYRRPADGSGSIIKDHPLRKGRHGVVSADRHYLFYGVVAIIGTIYIVDVIKRYAEYRAVAGPNGQDRSAVHRYFFNEFITIIRHKNVARAVNGYREGA